jgi:hypothetical protein
MPRPACSRCTSFIELMTDWFDDVQKLDSETLASLMKMGSRVQKLLEVKDRMKQAASAWATFATEGGGAMDSLDPLLLARIQFAANISFHILFPTITIALGWVLLSSRLRFTCAPVRRTGWMPTSSGSRCSR